ncbi:tRNA uridine-5-carboxymethylaminomethyl(34) synthesis GTPase MnmE [Candidatus Karelsulcia muelleri]|uniref:tRNA uridine-5-carboxymethylaminomethyl(34) synthesis GTPase MnmE n=1 Tax=Candidatus Karelsulcia muelleri TaxID=336810 RepID=UPI00130E3798|nr:tRNA uridine-5-carboxymethylaminomethyl(34) synthesis GTPase MnmE [Candidatus Karelsulcia muelleri]WDI79527.1 tRNA uridine-5-carboxymethylaminomethyl(34) synthesis GTPase MnmE [Candidatus Karelsulcia muelleri]WDR78984.1 tRNA uridine-5-carboxymethylaminomethyl(34) synthesis GTPase MnmE [Candidatus Karelsulcia muelleri]
MFFNNKDTITAIATPNGIGAIAIIRISGKLCFKIVSSCFVSKEKKQITELKTNTMYLGFIKQNKKLIDKVFLCLFKQPFSYTGEDLIEIYCHGTLYIQNKILKFLIDNGARLANPGEFSLRSFKNGKIDLIQAEALSELFKAEDEAAHSLAIKNLNGKFSIFLKEIRKDIIYLNSLINVSLDFDEDNISEFNYKKFITTLVVLIKKIKITIIGFKKNNILKKGYYLVLVGRPNVGKSTLFNLLLKKERSIVSNISGTTINYIEEDFFIKGIKSRIVDTAGIKENKLDKLDIKGIHKTYETINSADLILVIKDKIEKDLEKDFKISRKKQIIIIINKCDLLKQKIISNKQYILISAKYRIGLERIKKQINKRLNYKYHKTDNIINNMRNYECLKQVLLTLMKIKKTRKNSLTPEIFSFLLREANYHLGKITKIVNNDEIFNQIFATFCLGK